MRAVFLLLAAAATIGAAPGRYGAGGSEPWWSLAIEHGRISYDPADGHSRIVAPAPRPRPIRNGYRLVTPRLIVEVRHVRCEDEALRDFADTVRVTAYGRTLEGCGGRVLPPPTLDGTDWVIASIAGTPVRGDGFSLRFAEGRMSGQAGCNMFNGAYRERRPTLTFGALTVTRRVCPAPRMALERRALRILTGPVRMNFVDGDSLILTGRGGSIRLRP